MDSSHCILVIIVPVALKQEQSDLIRLTDSPYLRLNLAVAAKDDFKNRKSDGFIKLKK